MTLEEIKNEATISELAFINMIEQAINQERAEQLDDVEKRENNISERIRLETGRLCNLYIEGVLNASDSKREDHPLWRRIKAYSEGFKIEYLNGE